MISSLEIAKGARLSALKMVAAANASHIGSALSLIDIIAVLYAGAAKVNAENPSLPDRDRIIVSKGHAAAAYYAVLCHSGFASVDLLTTYCSDGSPLNGHVTVGALPGVEFSTGSLGHGLPFGVGTALATRNKGISATTFVVMSDGECNEGSVWEAALIAAHHEVANLVAVIDRNGLQSFGSTEETTRLEPLAEKWRSFGWLVLDVDGHNHEKLREAFDSVKKGGKRQPTVVIARTTKGKGVSFMENSTLWHYRSPQGAELSLALSEIENS